MISDVNIFKCIAPLGTLEQGMTECIAMQPGFPMEASDERYALLHDFCMQIPFSVFIFFWGVKLAIFTHAAVGMLHIVAGLILAACAGYSLNRWKRGLVANMSSLISATMSTYLAWVWGVHLRA
jgi:hypothetical protein